MTTLLYLNASPRGDDSASTIASQVYLDSLSTSVQVDRLDLFDAQLPDFGKTLATAKQKVTMGQGLTDPEQTQWQHVIDLVDQFVAADHYLLAVPMWNFGIPYKLKQYIDLITHPGMTFSMGPKGMRGLASGSATVVYARGGDYSPKDGQADPFDFQSPYLRAWLNLVGVEPVTDILVQRTMAGPDAQDQAVASVSAQLQQLASNLA